MSSLAFPAWMKTGGAQALAAPTLIILMTSLYTVKPLDFMAFPAVLLMSTMLRLSLNVASTRVVLT